MANNIIQPIIDKLQSAAKVLIVLPPQAGGDDLGAALALYAFLNKQDKQAMVVGPGNISPRYKFLSGYQEILPSLSVNRSFVIDVSTKQTKLEELSYQQEQDKLSILLKPQTGQFNESDLSFRTQGYPFDLVITINLASLEHLGEFYAESAELFFETPIINIDRQAHNENYGQYNLINLKAASTSEIVFDLVSRMDHSAIDPDLATSLLTGMITETNSFQHIRTTPQAFSKASELIGLGGRQQEIITTLFKNKSLGLLKLWGRVLARLKQDPSVLLAHSTATLSDHEKAQATDEDADQIIREMMSQLSFAKLFLFCRETKEGHTIVDCGTTAPINLSSVFAAFKPEVVAQTVRFKVPMHHTQTEEEMLKILRREMGKA